MREKNRTLPQREDCIHHEVCKFNDAVCPMECWYFEQAPSLDNLEVVEECRICKGKCYVKYDDEISPCSECQEGRVTRAATWEEGIEALSVLFKQYKIRFGLKSGGILRVKGEE